MLVVEHDNGLRLMRQRDHAAMSGRVAAAWQRPAEVPAAAWTWFVQAAGHHDDGWEEPDAAPTVDSEGRPHDFKSMPTVRHVAIWRQSIDRAADLHPCAGLLVALHARYLYTHAPSNHVEEAAVAQRFVDELSGRIDRALAACARMAAGAAITTPATLDRLAGLLRFLDALTLALAGAVGWPANPGPLPCGAGTVDLTLRREGEEVTLAPWPLDPALPELWLEAPVAFLPCRTFASEQALREALDAAAWTPARWRLRPAR